MFNKILAKSVSVLVMTALLGMPTGPLFAASPNVPQSNISLAQDFQTANDAINQLDTLNNGRKNSFTQKLDAALASYNRGQACTSINQIDAFLNSASAERKKNQALGENLYVIGSQVRGSVMRAIGPGGGCRGSSNPLSDPQIKIGKSDNTGIVLDITLPDPQLSIAQGGGETFARVTVPGVESMIGEPGQPAIPVWHTIIGIPQGSSASLLSDLASTSADIPMNLVPFQPEPVDPNNLQNDIVGNTNTGNSTDASPSVFADKPFVKNAQAYAGTTFLPPGPCKIMPIGKYRDLEIVQLSCATGQYNPTTDVYRPNHSIHVEVAYRGGNGKFITSQSLSPFEGAGYVDSVVNKDVIKDFVSVVDVSNLPCSGEELLLLTHPNFRDAADNLAAWKREKGIATNVFEVGTGTTLNTAAKIDKFIEGRYDKCKVRPSYVLLMGDAEFIPTFYPYSATKFDNAGSDFPYANYVQFLFDAFIPDFGVGRIPVDTNDQAQVVVDKIIKYEKTPPNLGLGSGAPFYTTVGLASHFQCCQMNQDGTATLGTQGTDQRAFVETSEFVRNSFLNYGYTMPRIYTKTVDGGGYCLIDPGAGNPCPPDKIQKAYTSDSTPRKYFNGTALPSAIGPGSGFAWSGNATNITNDWNAGRFLFIHRDHGGPNGWGNPGFSTADIPNLTNGDLQPVVFSVNCASGLFDNETAGGIYGTTAGGVYFAEQLLRKSDGGAIGIIGDTRNSPTWANNALLRGYVDATWPNTVSGFGSGTSRKRLGDILNWGKIYLATQVGIDQTAGDVTTDEMGLEYHIWNLIGDPTLEMWTKNPHKFILPIDVALQAQNSHFNFSYPVNGATITVLQLAENGTTTIPIGRATVVNGVASMDLLTQPTAESQILVSASLADASSVQLRLPTQTQ